MSSFDPEHPNVVFILSDDQATWGVGCYGNDEIKTPNIDRLADGGVRMEGFYCTSPVCSPSRASMLTGQIPSRHGVHDAILGGNVGPDAVPYLMGQSTYTATLAENGYACGLSGKWHLGDSLHEQAGFSHWFAHQREGSVYHDAPVVRDGRLDHAEGYLTDAITDDAIRFIGSALRSTRPFYSAVHYTAPHAPWIDEHPQDLVDMYDDCEFRSCPQEPEHPWFRQFHDADGNWSPQSSYMAEASASPREHLKGYFAAVTAMDRSIGRLLAFIEESGLVESTLICFLSDNGFNAGHHGIWGKGNGTSPQNMYETSVRVPAIISHPGRIEPGVDHSLRSGYDIRASLLEYLGVADPSEGLGPGRSFAAGLRGERSPGQEHVVVLSEYGPVRMVRTTSHKLIVRHPEGPNELYDLEDDPDERVNLIEDPARRGVRRDLDDRLQAWFAEHSTPSMDGASLPVTGCGQFQPLWGRTPPHFGQVAVDSHRRNDRG